MTKKTVSIHECKDFIRYGFYSTKTGGSLTDFSFCGKCNTLLEVKKNFDN